MKLKLPNQKVLYLLIGGAGIFLTYYIWKKSKQNAQAEAVLPGGEAGVEGSTTANTANEEREVRQKRESEEATLRQEERAEGKENKTREEKERVEERSLSRSEAEAERQQINHEKSEAFEQHRQETNEQHGFERGIYELEHPQPAAAAPVSTAPASQVKATVAAHAKAKATKTGKPAQASHRTEAGMAKFANAGGQPTNIPGLFVKAQYAQPVTATNAGARHGAQIRAAAEAREARATEKVAAATSIEEINQETGFVPSSPATNAHAEATILAANPNYYHEKHLFVGKH